MKIKVCGMRNASNIEELVTLPIHYIGFIFYEKSARYVPDEAADEIPELVPEHIEKTGVFVNATEQFILEKTLLFDLEVIQLHGSETPDFCARIHSLTHKKIIKAFGVDENFDFSKLEPYKKVCDFFLFDTKSTNHGGTGEKFNWEILKKYNNEKPFFLSGGIAPNDVETIKNLTHLNIHALDLNSKFEKQPALKDIATLKKFIDNIL